MNSEKIIFTGESGAPLAARLDLPPSEPRAWALFAHCFTCTKDSVAAARVSSALAAQGVATLRFDFTGFGGSGGDFANTSFSGNVEDVLLAAEWLATERGAPSLLLGHSLGGAAVLAAAAGVPSCKAVATVGAPCGPGHVRHLLRGSVDEILNEGVGEVSVGGRPFRIKRAFLEDLDEHRMLDIVGQLDRPYLILHAPGDKIVDVENARRLYEAAHHPKSYVSLDDADHLLTRRLDAAWVATVVASWASRYLDDGEAAVRESDEWAEGAPQSHEPRVRVTETGRGRFQQEILAGAHRIIGDEPRSYGGDDSGPTPYQLLLAALGTCTSMTLRMYAGRQGWALDRVRVTLDHQKVHAEDSEEAEAGDDKAEKIDEIRRLIEIDGDLDDEQRARLLEIADRCPVHRTLHGEIRVITEPA